MTVLVVPLNVAAMPDVIVAPELNVKPAPTTIAGVPLTVRVPVAATMKLRLTVQVFVHVAVPFTVKPPVLFGLFPRGQVVPSATVRVLDVMLYVTRFRVQFGAASVLLVPPAKWIVPPLALKVGVFVCVNVPVVIVQVPLVIVREPPESANPVKLIAWLAPVHVPPLTVMDDRVNAAAWFQVPPAMENALAPVMATFWVMAPE
jgi:hypothetical protein